MPCGTKRRHDVPPTVDRGQNLPITHRELIRLARRRTALFVNLVLPVAAAVWAGVADAPDGPRPTARPLSLGTIAATSWVGITETGTIAWLSRLLPGGATVTTELDVDIPHGGSPAEPRGGD